MRKLFLVFVSVLIGKFSFSQNPNFIVDGSKWIYHITESCEPGQQTIDDIMEEDTIHGDTLINSIIYKKLYTYTLTTTYISSGPFGCLPSGSSTSSNHYGPQYLRYDSALKKVFILTDTSAFERVLYDFQLNVGDSLPANWAFTLPSQFAGLKLIIDSIVPINFFGHTTNKYYFSDTMGLFAPLAAQNYIIEGMGGSNGLYFNFYPNWVTVSGQVYMTQIQCFTSGDSIYSPAGGSCNSLVTGINSSAIENLLPVIFPNPASDKIVVNGASAGYYEVADFAGKLLMSRMIQSSHFDVDLSNLSPGIFFITFHSDKLKTHRIIVKE